MEENSMTKTKASRSAVFATGVVTFLLVLTCLFGLFLIGQSIYGVASGRMEVPAHQRVAPERLGSLPSDVVQPEDVPVTIRIRDASPLQVTLSTARDLIVVGLGLALLWQMRNLLLSVRRGDPFIAENVRRLRTIGFVLILGFPIATFVTSLLESWLADTSDVGVSGPLSIDIGPALVAGLGVFVLAEVFAHGARLREDVQGTV
jgi:DUF2975 family protein